MDGTLLWRMLFINFANWAEVKGGPLSDTSVFGRENVVDNCDKCILYLHPVVATRGNSLLVPSSWSFLRDYNAILSIIAV